MKNSDKTREQLLKYLEKSKKRISELEKSEIERERAEEALQESEKQLQTLIDAMPDFVCFKDGDGRWLKANDAGVRIFQLEGIDYRGKKDSELAALNSNLRGTFLTCKESDARAWKEGNIIYGEETVPDPDGSVRVYDVVKVPIFDPSGERKGLVILGHDITERKQAEELLQKSEARLRQIIDIVPHMIFAKDRDGRFIMANKAVADGCGTTPENMIEKTHPELLGASPEQYESYLKDDREVIDSGKLKFIPEEDYTHPDGHMVIMETIKIPFTSAGIPAVLGVSIDITERKKAEEELKKYRQHLEELVKERTKELKNAQEELIRKEQLAILGQFSGSISHELRNPLAVIDSSIYYLKMKLKESDETIHKHLERIGSSVYNSTTIIDSLLSLTRMKKPEKSRNNLISLVSDSIRNTKIPAKVEVIQDFPDEEIPVNVEYEQCRIALKNIIYNACEAMDNDGTLTVTIQKIKEKRAEISFKDTGQGIALENIEKIFLPLFSTKARGIGFGLSISKMVIENHGGTLSVKSEPGKGADFIISLPIL